MVKTVIVGVWAALVALGTFYGVVLWKAGAEAKVAPKELFTTLEQVKTDVVSVPMISDGEVQGYVLARFGDFQRIEKYDLAKLTERLKESVNKRLGAKLVHDVLVDSINYVARSEIRYRGLKQ